MSQDFPAEPRNETAPHGSLDGTLQMAQREGHAVRTRMCRGIRGNEDVHRPCEAVRIAPASCAAFVAQEVGEALGEPCLAGIQVLEAIVDKAGHGFGP